VLRHTTDYCDPMATNAGKPLDALDLIALGEPLVVMLPDRSGPLRAVPRFERGIAGAECNVLLGMARLGGRGGLITRVGSDEFGHFVVETLRAVGIDTSRVEMDRRRPTGLYFREIAALNHSRPIYYRAGSAAAALSVDQIEVAYLVRARAFLTTGITALLSASAHDAVCAALMAAHEHGLTTYFDPNLRNGLWGSARARQLIRPLLRYVDVFLGGEDEAALLTGRNGSPEKLATAVTRLGPREVVIKRGSAGAHGFDGDTSHSQAALPTVFKDAVGAGDGFNAGYITFRQRGAALEEALRAGAICGASVCSSIGDFESFPRTDDLSVLMSDASAH